MKELSLHILDIVQNSVSAGAKTVTIEVVEDVDDNIYSITISDDGKGINKEDVEKVTDPFYTTRTTRKVGLGLPLLKQNAELAGGYFSLDTEVGKGTKVTAVFQHNHIDRPIMGDIAGVVVLNVASYQNIRWIYVHKTNISEYKFDSLEIKEVLGDLDINQTKVIKFLKEMINENLSAINYSD